MPVGALEASAGGRRAVLDVTVVIPTYRRPHFVRQAVESVLRQTLPAQAVVVVSDGPDLATRDALAGLDVEYLEAPHGGVSQARNVGIAAARTPWVAFLDDDCLWHPEFLERVAAYVARRSEAQALDAGHWEFAAPGFPGEVDFYAETLDQCLERIAVTTPRSSLAHLDIEGDSFERMLERMAGSMSTAVVRRDLLLAVGGFPSGRICAEDWTVFTNVARFVEWHLVPGRLAFFRSHPHNNTSARALLNGPATLQAIADMWDEESLPWPDPRPSKDAYRTEYRFTLRQALLTATDARRWDVYVECLRQGRRILRPSDVLRAMKPSRRLLKAR